MCEGSHSPRAKAAISCFIVLFLLLVGVADIPLTGFRKAVSGVEEPALAATGARQVWNVFAPDPPGVIARTYVRFHYSDGTQSVWQIKRGDPFVGPYRDYRWLKLAENTASSDLAAGGLLVWAARHRAEPKHLVRAELVRSLFDTAKPGRPRTAHPPAKDYVRLTLTAAG